MIYQSEGVPLFSGFNVNLGSKEIFSPQVPGRECRGATLGSLSMQKLKGFISATDTFVCSLLLYLGNFPFG